MFFCLPRFGHRGAAKPGELLEYPSHSGDFCGDLFVVFPGRHFGAGSVGNGSPHLFLLEEEYVLPLATILPNHVGSFFLKHHVTM